MSYSNDNVINVDELSKYFEIYEKPVHRLWQMILHGKKKFYKPFWALSHISFNVYKGECVGIIGRNGAGKSTLLQIITGTLAPSSGYIKTSGRLAALLELGSGFNPDFTGKENIYLNASILGLNKSEIDSKYNDIISFADIGDFINQPIKSYSSGMIVRLAFSVIAHVNADVLIIDEALSVGDAFFTQKCMRFLRNFMKFNTVLFVSHDISAINSLCTRAILLEDGRVKAIDTPKKITEIYLEDMFISLQGESELNLNKNVIHNNYKTEDKDMRSDLINSSSLRNDIQVFAFDENGTSFGKGGASIEFAKLADKHGTQYSWIIGGEAVVLYIECQSHKDLYSPIIGFQLKDRLGQVLIGDNTFLSFMNNPLYITSGKKFSACFEFTLPMLPAGDYSFSVAIAEGTQDDHVQHHWRHDAIVLKSVNSSICTGLLGVPMKRISFDIHN